MNAPSFPVLLTRDHQVERFRSGEQELDAWLTTRALRNQENSSSRTFVVASAADVVGYYSLAAGAVAIEDAPGPVRRNAPNPVPAIILGRLAVDQSQQGLGLGSALLRNAVIRTRRISESAGVRALVVHAISERARQFYLQRGFLASPTDQMTLLLPEKALRG